MVFHFEQSIGISMRLSLVAFAVLVTVISKAEPAPSSQHFVPVTLAKTYETNKEISQYWASEKLDGIRVVWNGQFLHTRSGKKIYAPLWFTAPLPNKALDGELWAGRGNFHLVQRTVLDRLPTDSAWRNISFVVFDLPHKSGDYRLRYEQLTDLLNLPDHKHILPIKQKVLTSEDELMAFLAQVENLGGEGVMLRHIDSPYISGRNDSLLKLKSYQDKEARVIGYKRGKGKFKGKIGSVLVRTEDNLEFYIGSGLTDEHRSTPIALGALVTFKYNGVTHNGIPRFARLLRVKTE
jgi:DNA ligase-1